MKYTDISKSIIQSNSTPIVVRSIGYNVVCSEVRGTEAINKIEQHLKYFIKYLYPKHRRTDSYKEYINGHVVLCNFLIQQIKQGASIYLPISKHWRCI